MTEKRHYLELAASFLVFAVMLFLMLGCMKRVTRAAHHPAGNRSAPNLAPASPDRPITPSEQVAPSDQVATV